MEPDFTVRGRGSDTVFLLTPESEAGKQWAALHLPSDSIQLGRGFCVEHRYILPILNAIRCDGLAVAG